MKGDKAMKKIFLFVILAGIFFCSIGNAQEEGFGLGVILGEPTGLCFKSWIQYRTALVGAAAWSFGDEDSLHIHLDYVRHDFKLIKIEEDSLPFYYGIGFRLKNEKKVRFGIRFPIGVNYMFKKAPLDLFIEFVPVFDLAPKTDLFFNGGFGLRYFF
jgi:hypothetical protein